LAYTQPRASDRFAVADSPAIAQIQSSIEAHLLATNFSRGTIPAALSAAAIRISEELTGWRKAAPPSPHVSDIGFPLTLAESFLLKTGILQRLDKNLNSSSVQCELIIQLATLVAAHGFHDPSVRKYYESSVEYLGGQGSNPLVDLGWLNEFFGTLQTYLGPSHGKHTYRQATSDRQFGVTAMQQKTSGSLRIGILADWGCGTPEAAAVLNSLKAEKPDVVIHLGDVYYSGTLQEQQQFLLQPLRAAFGEGLPILLIPGNHDYYSGGSGFFEVIDELKQQEASFFALRGSSWQLIGLDTALLDNFNLAGLASIAGIKGGAALPFLPDDQVSWALDQIQYGQQRGLKTIIMSHHQFFSRTEVLGIPNSPPFEASTLPDRLAHTYEASEYSKPSTELPGRLARDQFPGVNTRLLDQFNQSIREYVSAFYWGHEHSHAVFEPYAGIKRGRMLGNGCIPTPADYNVCGINSKSNFTPWGGAPDHIDGSHMGRGDDFWNLGFVTIDLNGSEAHVRHLEVPFHNGTASPSIVRFMEKY